MGYQGIEKSIQIYWKSIIANVDALKRGSDCAQI